MKRKSFEIFSYVSLIIILIFLALMLFRLVPGVWFPYLLGISIALFIVRIVLRIYFVVQDKKNNKGV